MAAKLQAPRSSGPSSAPLGNAILLGVALCSGLGTLFARGRLEWPPTQLLASAYTVAGCVALIGPIVIGRRGSSEVGLGDLLWMVGGLVIWIFDGAALARGDRRSLAWATPLGYQPMGLTVLAVLIAGWRCRVAGASWSWTNVTGWLLGVFWVAMAGMTLVPTRILGLALR